MEIDGAEVKRLRLARAYSQRELGKLAGVTQETVLEIERGQRQRVYPATLRGLAEALGVTPPDITKDEMRNDD